MKKSVKAVLISALVYPGLGHLYLKKYTHFVIYSFSFSVPLYFIFSEILAKAQLIAEQIQNGEIALNITAISDAVTKSMTATDPQQLNIKMYLLLIIWLIALFDAYRLGQKHHITENKNSA